ncbi:MAG: hypothetical protein JO039_08935 [Solirubrobacterales bacterium]|nr:hypothetical protein [Solirubrobacterales bacterium]
MSVARYALGAASLAIVFGSLGAAAVALRRRFMGGWIGAPARLAEVVVGLAILVAILEVLGAIGLFRLGPVLVAAVLVGVGGARALRSRPAGAARVHLPGGPAFAAIVIAGAVAAEWAVPTAQSYDIGVRTFDSLWYHLPWAASFAQTGHITPLRFTDVEYLTAFYPASAELIHGLGIVTFGYDTVSPALNLLWLGLSLLAAWCIGRPRGAGAGTAAGAALALATPMMYFSQAGSAANDIVGVFFLLAAVALLMNGEGEAAPFVLAAISAGLAVSVKLSFLGPVLALTLGALTLAPAGRRLARAGLWLGPLLLAGGFWYARNLVAVGNPLPWTSLRFLPTPAAPLQQGTGFALAHYIGDGRVWSHFVQPGLTAGLGGWWYVILALAVLGPVLCLLPGAGRTVRTMALVALASLAAYVITPETAAGPRGDPLGFAFNLRYAAPGLSLSLAVVALAPAWAGVKRQAALVAGLVAVLVATLAQPSLWPSRHATVAVLAGFAVLLGASAVLAFATGRAPGQRAGARQSPLLALAATAAVALIAAAGAGYALERHYLRGRYTYVPGVSSLSRVWALFRSVHDSRVGVVGTFGGFFSYPLFGLDSSNRVQYVAQRGAHGSFTPIRTCSGWRTAVNDGRYRYLVTTPARDPWHPSTLEPSPEWTWTGSDPAARVIYSQRALGQPIVVYELNGPLDPFTCARAAGTTSARG